MFKTNNHYQAPWSSQPKQENLEAVIVNKKTQKLLAQTKKLRSSKLQHGRITTMGAFNVGNPKVPKRVTVTMTYCNLLEWQHQNMSWGQSYCNDGTSIKQKKNKWEERNKPKPQLLVLLKMSLYFYKFCFSYVSSLKCVIKYNICTDKS